MSTGRFESWGWLDAVAKTYAAWSASPVQARRGPVWLRWELGLGFGLAEGKVWGQL